MRILDLYIGKTIAATTFMTAFVLIGLSGLIRFIEQMKSVGKGNYDVAQAFFYVLFSVPRDIEVFIPMAALIGGLIGLGLLASHSELVIMKASGLSQLDIIKSVMKTATVMVVLVMILAEWGSPKSEAFAREMRAQAISGGSLISSKRGVWAKDGDAFVHIGEVADTVNLADVTMFNFDDELGLESIEFADTATYEGASWKLTDTWKKTITVERIYRHESEEGSWSSSLTPDKLGVVTVKPESLSIQGLLEYLDYLYENEQDARKYELALWRKILQPFTIAVMLLVALSFISGPLRTVTMGARIVLGIVVGFGFHVTNQIFGPMSLVYSLPPVLGALIPSLIFVAMAIYFLRKQTA